MGYITAEPERIRKWGDELKGITGFKIGIAWQGSKSYQDDRFRSIPLAKLEPIARIPGVRLVSLQKGHGSEQLGKVHAWNVLDFGKRLDEDGAFLDTAALMKQLDLVITSDTAIVHLAGALGVPVWLASSTGADWRWLQGRDDCPWYPSLRLFRQPKRGDWDGVFERMAREPDPGPNRPRPRRGAPVGRCRSRRGGFGRSGPGHPGDVVRGHSSGNPLQGVSLWHSRARFGGNWH